MASTIEIKIKRNFLKLKTYRDFYERVLGPSSFHRMIGRKERCEKFLIWAGIFSKENIPDLVKEDMKYLIKNYFKEKANPFI